DLKRKYEHILSRERSLARTVTHAVVEPKPLSVWEVMIPIIFILNYLKFKQTREISAQNFLFTKKLALKAAYDMIKNVYSRKIVMSRIEEKTLSILTSEKSGIYSEDIRQKQLLEIDLLIDHYCRLFNAQGENYGALVRNAYQSKESYVAFMGQLKVSEKLVNLAAQQALGTEKAAEVVSRMEQATNRVRMAEATKIFVTEENAK
ncbi:MAG: NF038143 family protein, partial [Candidatus Aerophobus sp.]